MPLTQPVPLRTISAMVGWIMLDEDLAPIIPRPHQSAERNVSALQLVILQEQAPTPLAENAGAVQMVPLVLEIRAAEGETENSLTVTQDWIRRVVDRVTIIADPGDPAPAFATYAESEHDVKVSAVFETQGIEGGVRDGALWIARAFLTVIAG